MDKLILLSMIIFFISNAAPAGNSAIPDCSCNDFSALLKSDKQIEEQTKKEIKQMDYEAENIKEKSYRSIKGENVFSKKYWWQFWR